MIKEKLWLRLVLAMLILVSVWSSNCSIGMVVGSMPPTEWRNTYGGLKDDWARSVVQTTDGGYAVAGYTESLGAGLNDFWLVRVDASGNTLWNKTYGGLYDDWAYSVVQTTDGGYAVAGGTDSFGAVLNDFWLVKVDASGNVQWNNTYTRQYDDVAYSVVQTADGGYAIVGLTEQTHAGPRDVWLVRVDASGNMLWSETYGGLYDDGAYSVVQTTPDGGYAIAGFTKSFGSGGYDFWLVKTDSIGNVQWNKTYGGLYDDGANSVVQSADGGYVIAGYTRSFGVGFLDFWLVKVDGSGNMLWNKTYGGSQNDVAYSVVQTADGGYAIAGSTDLSGAGFNDFWLVRVNEIGSMLWSGTYGGSQNDVAYSVVQTTPDGGYAIAGATASFGAGGYDFWLVKVPTIVRDVAITDVTPSKTVVCQGYMAHIMVTVENQGNSTETFNVTAYYGVNIIGNQTVNLHAGATQTITFTWNTIGVTKGSYTIGAYAWPVPGETDTADNTRKDGWVIVAMKGDISGSAGVPDGKVDIDDVFPIALAFGSLRGPDGKYRHPTPCPTCPHSPNCDITNDGIIDIDDVIIPALNFGKTDP